MLEKWQRQPARVGMLMGFVALPLAWWLRDALLRMAFGFSSDTRLYFELLHFFATGALAGAILGAGLSKAAFVYNQGNLRAAKRQLVTHSALVIIFSLAFINATVPGLQSTSLKIVWMGREMPFFIGAYLASVANYFPIHPAILMLFLGLLMRSRR